MLPVFRYLLVRVVELLPQGVLDEVELADWYVWISADVSILEIVCRHRLQSQVLLLLCLHAHSSLIKEVALDNPVISDINALPLLKN